MSTIMNIKNNLKVATANRCSAEIQTKYIRQNTWGVKRWTI